MWAGVTGNCLTDEQPVLAWRHRNGLNAVRLDASVTGKKRDRSSSRAQYRRKPLQDLGTIGWCFRCIGLSLGWGSSEEVSLTEWWYGIRHGSMWGLLVRALEGVEESTQPSLARRQ